MQQRPSSESAGYTNDSILVCSIDTFNFLFVCLFVCATRVKGCHRTCKRCICVSAVGVGDPGHVSSPAVACCVKMASVTKRVKAVRTVSGCPVHAVLPRIWVVLHAGASD